MTVVILLNTNNKRMKKNKIIRLIIINVIVLNKACSYKPVIMSVIRLDTVY